MAKFLDSPCECWAEEENDEEPICSECKAHLDILEYEATATVSGMVGLNEEIDELENMVETQFEYSGLSFFKCPYCSNILFTDFDEAKEFLS